MHNEAYGKHVKKEYLVWMIAGPTGPVYEYTVLGLEEAKESVEGAWAWKITRKEDGVVVA